jgi:hypothetical protein
MLPMLKDRSRIPQEYCGTMLKEKVLSCWMMYQHAEGHYTQRPYQFALPMLKVHKHFTLSSILERHAEGQYTTSILELISHAEGDKHVATEGSSTMLKDLLRPHGGAFTC